MKYFPLILLVITTSFISCKNRMSEVSWDTQMLVPLAHSSLKIEDILDGDTSIVTNTDNSLSIIYRSELYSVRPLDTAIDLQVPPFSREITLESLELGNQQIQDTLKLGEMVPPDSQGDMAFVAFLLYSGALSHPVTLPPAGQNLDPDPFYIDISEYFVTAVLNEGLLDFTLDNQFQLDIETLDIEIKNTNNNVVIYQESFTDIPAYSSITRNIDLAAQLNGEAIEGQLTATVSNVSMVSPEGASGNAQFSPEEYVAFGLTLREIKVQSAEAIFPAQNVIDYGDTVGIQGLDDVQLTRATIKDGYVNVVVRSTLPTELNMTYEIPKATDNLGNPFIFTSTTPAAPPGGTIDVDSNFYFDGYDFDFTGQFGELTNTFYNTIIASMVPTPEPIPLSLDDTLAFSLTVEEMKAEYVEGYVGQQVYNVPAETAQLELPNALKQGGLTFEDVNITVIFENQLGVPASINMSTLSGTNNTTSESASLNPLPPTFIIEPATQENGVVQSTFNTFSIENAANVFNVHPDEITYGLDIVFNPDGNIPAFSNFAYTESEIIVNMDVEVPLSINAEDFVLSDTIDFLEESVENPSAIKGGILKFIVDNGFPIDIDLSIYFLDEGNTVIDSLLHTEIIRAANLDDTEKVVEPLRSVIDYEITPERLSNILNAKTLIVQGKFDTQGAEYVKIYSDYTMNLQLSGDFEYELNGEGF